MRSERNNALYVSRETGAQRLDICPRTWDDWVKAGILPKPYKLGISGTTPRWLWTEVDEWISRRAGSQVPAVDTTFNIEALRGRYGQTSHRRTESP